MNDDLSIYINSHDVLKAYAEMKGFPLKKIVHNAAKDFAQAAQETTPLAQIEHAKYFRAFIPHGKHWWIPIEKVGHTVHNKPGKVQLWRWLKRGWSKATWIGIMRALGMTTKKQPRKSSDAEHAKKMSSVTVKETTTSAEAAMTDRVYFDQWTKGTDYTSEPVKAKGFQLAARRIAKDFNDLMRERWLRNFR